MATALFDEEGSVLYPGTKRPGRSADTSATKVRRWDGVRG